MPYRLKNKFKKFLSKIFYTKSKKGASLVKVKLLDLVKEQTSKKDFKKKWIGSENKIRLYEMFGE